MLRMNRRITTGRTEAGSTRFVETANFGGGFGGSAGLSPGTSSTAIASPQIELPLLDGFAPIDRGQLNRLYREIYYSDSVAGSAIDLLSTLPFSDFSLTGMQDERRLLKYVQCVERLRIRQLLPVLSVDLLVLGAFVGTLNWNGQSKMYDALLPQNIDFCQFENVPIFGADPIITLTFPPELQKAIKSNDERLKQYLDQIPDAVKTQMTNKGTKLAPEDVIFIGRSGTTADYAGSSALRRVLPIWLIEKALIRGTLDQAWKRQRPIMHVTAGDPDWPPTADDLSLINQLFLEANGDPTGAIVVTRDGINVNEVRRGDDFWKYNDIYEWSSTAKLRALGISESFMTGEGSITNMENTISVTLQHFANYRDMVTRELFYEKTFPTLALENGFFRKQNVSVASEERMASGLNGLGHPSSYAGLITEHGFIREVDGTLTAEIGRGVDGHHDISDRSRFEMPKVHWHNSLKPDNSQEYLQTLTTLEEKGVPIPLRMFAAAGGMSIRELVEQRDSDIKVREYFKPWIQQIRQAQAELEGQNDDVGGGGGPGGFAGASSVDPDSFGPVGIMNRTFDDSLDPYGLNSKGQHVPVSAERRKQINERANKTIAIAAAEVHAKANHKEIERQKDERKRAYSYPALPKPEKK